MSLYITDENGKLHKIAGAGGGSGVVDDALNPDSENPVQNKVLYDPVSFAEKERVKSENNPILHKNDINSWVSLANPLIVNTISSNYVAVDISSVVDQFVDGAEYEVMAMWGIDGAIITSGTIVVSVYTDLLGSATGAITIFTDPATNTRRNVSIMPCKRYLYYKTSDVAKTNGLYLRVYAYRRIK